MKGHDHLSLTNLKIITYLRIERFKLNQKRFFLGYTVKKWHSALYSESARDKIKNYTEYFVSEKKSSFQNTKEIQHDARPEHSEQGLGWALHLAASWFFRLETLVDQQ
jgi:hypothetical protein